MVPEAALPLTVTLADPCAEEQPFEFVSTTLSVRVPATPAVNVIWLVPFPLLIVPLTIDQAYVLPAWFVTEAMRPVSPGLTFEGAVIAGVAGVGLTVTVTVGPLVETQPPELVTVSV
jgi:hypothetical protein